MKLFKRIALLSALLFSISTYAQTQGSVKGKVVDEATGKPLTNASISIVGSKKGTTTDEQGNFTLKIADASKTYKITVSYTGHLSKDISVKNGDNITVKLKESAKEEDEVVVQTGLGGAIKKKELTGSVATTTAKDLKDIPVNNVGEALNGRLAGVTATTAEGSPDADIRIKVRGGSSITQTSEPLYIVDGVQVENGLSGIVLQDIQDITVLKDAATISVYGARGANGVIIITTKSGKVGGLKVTYNMFYGIKNITKTLGVMSPYEFVLYNYERNLGSTTDSSSFVGIYGTFDTFYNYKNQPSVNWQEEVMGQQGYSQMHNIGVSGGVKKWQYNFSYTFNDDKAIVLNSAFKRHQLNFKNDFKLSSKLKATLGLRYTNQNVFGAGVSDDRQSTYNRLRNAIKYKPYLNPGQSVFEEDPDAIDNPGLGLGLINPYQIVQSEFRRKTTDQFNITTSVNYNISKRFSFKSSFGFDRRTITDRQFSDSNSSIARNTSLNQFNNGMPAVTLDTIKSQSLNFSNSITYSLKNYRKKHDLEIIAGVENLEIQRESRENFFISFPNFTDKDVAFSNLSLGKVQATYPRLNKEKETQLSFFGVARYSLKKKYFATFSIRRDGSSKFDIENRWGNFYSGSLAWRVSDEKWFQSIKFINDFKLRVGMGSVGNNRIGNYLTLNSFNNQVYIYGLNGSTVQTFASLVLANKKIKWEALVNRNIGFDMSILKNRVDISFDYFNNTTKDLLLNVPIASTFGYARQLQNMGRTKSSGVEIQIAASILQKKNGFNWNANFNISFVKNQIDALGIGMNTFSPAAASFSFNTPPPDYVAKIGEPLGAMMGYVYDGFYTTNDFDYNTTTQQYTLKNGVVNNAIIGTVQPGSIKFRDLNGDGTIDINNDRTVIGNPNPKFTGGFNNQFTYKNWDASIFLNFSVGNDVFNANRIEFTNGYTNRSNLISEMENRWKTVAEDGTKLQWVAGNNVYGLAPNILAERNANASTWMPIVGNGAFHSHSWAIEDGSFLRVNNITIGYSFGLKTLAKLKISKLRIYATANNVAIFTKYSGYDPEVSVRRDPLTPALDYSAYPRSRSFLMGLNVSF